jgi:hypothetical protein
MQVLGDLILLPQHDSSLPLPWWHRAPLGLLHGTRVFVGLIESARPVGDLIISVLDINKWNNILRVVCKRDDKYGVIADALDAVLPLNIALAEAVTTEKGKEHLVTLFCEDKGTQKVKDFIPGIEEALEKLEFKHPRTVSLLSRDKLKIIKSDVAEIDHGWLKGVDFLGWVHGHVWSDPAGPEKVDLTRAVVSADTENRILRFIFPLKGAKTIIVRHRDIPGALRQIFLRFRDCELNVLSALLRRGGQKGERAQLIAVCEPPPAPNPAEVYERLRRGIEGLDQQFDASIRIAEGSPADEVLYVPPPHQRAQKGKQAVYYAAYHPMADGRAFDIARRGRFALEKNGCLLLEGAGESPATTSGYMERAEAGVLLLTGAGNTPLELAQDLGYLRALCKPFLLVMEDGNQSPCQGWAHGNFFTRGTFRGDLPQDQPGSLEAVLAGWLRTVRLNN